MSLGTYTPPTTGKAGSYDPRLHHGRPLIVVVREFRADFTTRKYPKPKDVVFVDVVDLLTDTVHVNVIWGGGAVVDRLKGELDKTPEGEPSAPLPVKLIPTQSATNTTYYVPEPLDPAGQEYALAVAWDAKYPTRIDDERTAKIAADKAAGVTQPSDNPPAANGQPVQTPMQGLGSAAPVAQNAPLSSDADLEAAIARLGGK